nr:cobyrinate a,c-diamide synthase [Desulfobacterales bacterium]
MKIPGVIIAGTHSGCGKTTVSLGIMAALIKRGFKVQAFKVGPDFIDPGYHRRITGRDAHNLDGWMLSQIRNREIFSRYNHDADIAVVEGVMGLFDGLSGDDESGSTAQMAKWLNLPVILVIDARSMARSAAAIALGFSRFDPDLRILGIIFNRVGSSVHAEILKEAISSLPDLLFFGSLPVDKELEIPSRYLGLLTDEEFALGKRMIDRLASWIETHIQLDSLLNSLKGLKIEDHWAELSTEPDVKIGIARDKAFCFYYAENIRLLKEAGADIVPFSPLQDNRLPEGVQGLYFGGGYPELYCHKLSENRNLLEEIRAFGDRGGPIYAECGGFMFLMKEIRTTSGKRYPMVGFFNMTAMMEDRLKSLGYREIVTQKESLLGGAGTRVRGHEFHYSRIQGMDRQGECIYTMTDRRTKSRGEEGFYVKNILGSYIHLHWGSNPDVARHFVDFCRRFGNSGGLRVKNEK